MDGMEKWESWNTKEHKKKWLLQRESCDREDSKAPKRESNNSEVVLLRGLMDSLEESGIEIEGQINGREGEPN